MEIWSAPFITYKYIMVVNAVKSEKYLKKKTKKLYLDSWQIATT